jgi:hypothetical protein
MNVIRSSERTGVYHVYWKATPSDESRDRFKRLIGFLKAEQVAILVGGTATDPKRLLTVGPLTEAQDRKFHAFFG